MPIGACAGTDPLKSIYLQGRLYQQAASGRSPTVALIGMWLLFAPFVLLAPFGVRAFFRSLPGAATLSDDFSGLLALPIYAVYAVILYKVTTNYVRSRRLVPGSRRKCGYNLFGLPERRRPQCGTPLDPEEVRKEQA